MIGIRWNRVLKLCILTSLLIILSWLMVFIVADLAKDVSIGIDAFCNSYSIGEINNETVATFNRPDCNISYWRNDCRNMKHRIHTNNVINLQELLYEEPDTEERVFENCTITLGQDGIRLKRCSVRNYRHNGTLELWWSNITIGKYSTMCYFVMEKQLDENDNLVSSKDNIESFIITRPGGIFSGYFKQKSNDIEHYNLLLQIFRGIAPICAVEEYVK